MVRATHLFARQQNLGQVNIMSLEYYLSGKGPEEFLRLLSACISTAGSEEFNLHYLEMIEKVIRADQCTVFSYRSERPECYLSYSERQKKSAQNLTQKYLRDGFKKDPLAPLVEDVRVNKSTLVMDLEDLKPKMSAAYLQTFFTGIGVVDKITVLGTNSDDLIGLNFYRYEENGSFSRSDPNLRFAFWDTILKITLLHFSQEKVADVKSPLNSLSKREKNICEAMLRGMTADAIAWELGISPSTVTTYRRRAYEKLGINSKSALFELCRRG